MQINIRKRWIGVGIVIYVLSKLPGILDFVNNYDTFTDPSNNGSFHNFYYNCVIPTLKSSFQFQSWIGLLIIVILILLFIQHVQMAKSRKYTQIRYEKKFEKETRRIGRETESFRQENDRLKTETENTIRANESLQNHIYILKNKNELAESELKEIERKCKELESKNAHLLTVDKRNQEKLSEMSDRCKRFEYAANNLHEQYMMLIEERNLLIESNNDNCSEIERLNNAIIKLDKELKHVHKLKENLEKKYDDAINELSRQQSTAPLFERTPLGVREPLGERTPLNVRAPLGERPVLPDRRGLPERRALPDRRGLPERPVLPDRRGLPERPALPEREPRRRILDSDITQF